MATGTREELLAMYAALFLAPPPSPWLTAEEAAEAEARGERVIRIPTSGSARELSDSDAPVEHDPR